MAYQLTILGVYNCIALQFKNTLKIQDNEKNSCTSIYSFMVFVVISLNYGHNI